MNHLCLVFGYEGGKKTEFRNIIKGIAKGLNALMIIFSTSIWQLTFNGHKRYENI